MDYEYQEFCAICGGKDDLVYYWNGPDPARCKTIRIKKKGQEPYYIYRRSCRSCYETIVKPLANQFGTNHPVRVREGFEKLSKEQLLAIVEIITKEEKSSC